MLRTRCSHSPHARVRGCFIGSTDGGFGRTYTTGALPPDNHRCVTRKITESHQSQNVMLMLPSMDPLSAGTRSHNPIGQSTQPDLLAKSSGLLEQRRLPAGSPSGCKTLVRSLGFGLASTGPAPRGETIICGVYRMARRRSTYGLVAVRSREEETSTIPMSREGMLCEV